MMTELEKIKEKLREHKPELKEKYNVEKIGIFGSYVHGDQEENSDVDILVEFSEPIGWEIIDLEDELEEILGLNVDLVPKGGIRSELKDTILKETVEV